MRKIMLDIGCELPFPRGEQRVGIASSSVRAGGGRCAAFGLHQENELVRFEDAATWWQPLRARD
jgi:hypothetical protein